MAYSPAGLHWVATGIDYYLWYKENAKASDDLTQYDAIALYLDTRDDRAASPQTDDYYFLVGLHGDVRGQATPEYRRQAHGTGVNWDTSWNVNWSDYSGWQWSSGGPNDNGEDIDFGWIMGGTIPWSALGLSGPPAEGTVWGMGMVTYDQDNQPPATAVILENWPEAFETKNPASWGEIHFGLASYVAPPAIPRGTTLIRAATPEDNTVEDSWVGGGGLCNAGHEGHGEDNHGNDSSLFAGSEIVPTHFPCFNKSYLRFTLNSVPAGKVIISAKLTLHHWGNAGDPTAPDDEDRGHDSFAWVYTVVDDWQEMTIHWNNAPLAQENLNNTRIPPLTAFPGWPGIPYQWDVTQAVAEAYLTGQPVNLAIYDSATGRNTSKYFTASEIGMGDGTPNWDIEGRPRLDVVWGDASALLSKHASVVNAIQGSPVSYTLNWLGIGQKMILTDTLPIGLSQPIVITATTGTSKYLDNTRQLTWSGTPTLGQSMIITYTVKVQVSETLILSNTAELTTQDGIKSVARAEIFVNGYQVVVPLIRR